jgi:hypothetical protein
MKIIVLTFIMRIEQLVKTENSKDLICQNYLIYNENCPQRVSSASVTIEHKVVADIQKD